ncbi:MAG: phosphate signaling complex protein PhoU [Oscillospiraceae bacterium]|jgi:phosphate transport system protein|nr:phosphate signaling complex protein PhoU [Oscillospiraceae bacterium]
MRQYYQEQLNTLHNSLVKMGALCEAAIAASAKALLEDNNELRKKTLAVEEEINHIERDIEQQCVRLLLHQQPMASDLRHVTAAQKMITDMERIGDQAADIADLSSFMRNSPVKSDVHIADMARATSKMVTDSIESFVGEDVEKARAVIAYDDVVDALFNKIKDELIERLKKDSGCAHECLDLLMIAKYFERIGDHAENLAECALYYLAANKR